jgi:putative MATE family efflux protein
MVKDMTVGNPGKTLFLFAVPMVLGNIFQQFYNIVDSVVVGKFVGADALAAVGASSSITFLFIAMATGLSIGSSVVISQLFGANQIAKMKTAIFTVIISTLVLSTFLMILGLAINKNILLFLNTPNNILNNAQAYLQIYFYSLIFLFLYNILNAVFNALGDSRTPLYFLMFSAILNIVLDLLLVIVFGLGVAGVALATLIAQGVSVVLSGIWLYRRISIFEVEEPVSIFDLQTFKKVCIIAIPSMIQQSIVSIGMLLVQRLVNGYGSIVVAGYTAATKIDNIAIMPMVNVGSAVSTFVAQNIGAKKSERIKSGYRAGLLMVISIGVLIAVILYLFVNQLVSSFVDKDTNKDVIAVGVEYLKVVSIFYFAMGMMNVTNGVLRGAGDMKIFMTSTFINLGTRVVLAYILSGIIGKSGIWWAIPTGWFAGFLTAFLRYRSGRWKNKGLLTDRV